MPKPAFQSVWLIKYNSNYNNLHAQAATTNTIIAFTLLILFTKSVNFPESNTATIQDITKLWKYDHRMNHKGDI